MGQILAGLSPDAQFAFIVCGFALATAVQDNLPELVSFRSKNGENDSSGKLRALASLASASTRLNRASPIFPKQP